MNDFAINNSSGDEDSSTGHLQLPDGVNLDKVEEAIKALLKYAAKSRANSVFMDESVRILMDLRAFKTPVGKHHFFNILLPNTPHKDLKELDVVLVVQDEKERDPDHVVGDVKDLLMESEVADKIKVREVMTLKQFRDDYSTYESKRALSKSVDVVIGEKQVYKLLPNILGREFFKKKKFPMQIPGRKLKTHDIGQQIWKTLHKTVLNLSLKGLKSTLVVGHDNLTEEQLAKNAAKIIVWLQKNFPGEWENIQSIHLHIGQPNMPPLPIYFSTGTRNDVRKRPITKGISTEGAVEDEISTRPGKRIKVFPNGEIQEFKQEERDPLDDIL